MNKIVTITDPYDQEHVLVYKSETEWTSYTKANYDELKANEAKIK
jgi:hypothetical protein